MSKGIRVRLTAALVATFALVFSIAPSEAAQCAAPGRDGNPSGLTGVVNAYWAATANVTIHFFMLAAAHGICTTCLQILWILMIYRLVRFY